MAMHLTQKLANLLLSQVIDVLAILECFQSYCLISMAPKSKRKLICAHASLAAAKKRRESSSSSVLTTSDPVSTPSDEEWIRCDHVWAGLKDEKQFFDMKCFPIVRNAPMILTVKTAIAIEGPLPSGSDERKRAHFSLPQPLHFRVTFVGLKGMTASLRYEQGNPPLHVVTREMREESWSQKTPFQFYLFADDMESCKRSDVAIYYDEDGMLVYRPAPYGNGNEAFFLTEQIMAKAAVQAKKYRLTEHEITDMKCEKYGSVIQVFALIDKEFTHTLRVTITTPTSKAMGYYSLPREDFSSATITVQPKFNMVTVGSDVIIAWSIPRVTKKDKIGIYAEHGRSCISHVCNEQELTSGAVELQAPSTPGRYEARYYPAWLFGSQSGQRHDLYVTKTFFEVTSS